MLVSHGDENSYFNLLVSILTDDYQSFEGTYCLYRIWHLLRCCNFQAAGTIVSSRTETQGFDVLHFITRNVCSHAFVEPNNTNISRQK
jgi:hypothetical protein